MNREELIIWLYLLVEAAYEAVTGGTKIRQCGRPPGLTDIEVITLIDPLIFCNPDMAHDVKRHTVYR